MENISNQWHGMACYGMVWIGTSKCIYAVVYMHPFYVLG